MKQIIKGIFTIIFCIVIAFGIYSCIGCTSNEGIAKVYYSIIYPDKILSKYF